MSSLSVNSVTYQYGKKNWNTGSVKCVGFAEKTAALNKEKAESVVETYKKKNPQSAGNVDNQVRAGKSVLRKRGVEDISREDMTMDEYKHFIADLMDSIPFDMSQRGNVEIWSISEDGWEQMKNDPDYEAWVLGYTVQNRSVRNPFAWMPGYAPSLCTEKFGASIEEHIGQSVPMMDKVKGGKNGTSSYEKSWWQERHERFEELMEAQAKEAWKKRRIAGAQIVRNHQKQSYKSFALSSYEKSSIGFF